MPTSWGTCSLCRTKKNVAYNSSVDDDVCSACYRRELQPRSRCSQCGTVRVICSRPDGVHGYCNRCYLSQVLRGVCKVCHLRKPIAIRHHGKPVCAGCYRREFASREACAVCGTSDVVLMRQKNGDPVCPNCYQERFQPREVCAHCKSRDIVKARTDGGKALCATCYRLTVQRAKCAHCGRTSRIITRTRKNEPVCATCYANRYAAREVCAWCKQLAHVKRRLDDGRAACATCYVRELCPRERCTSCRRLRPVARRDGKTVLCSVCNRRARLAASRRAPARTGSPGPRRSRSRLRERNGSTPARRARG